MSRSSNESGLSTRIPYHLKGKRKYTGDDEEDPTAIEMQSHTLKPDNNAGGASWRSSIATAVSPSPVPASSEVVDVVRMDSPSAAPTPDPTVTTSTQSLAKPVSVHRTYGGTPRVGPTMILDDVHSTWAHHVHLNGTFYHVLLDALNIPRSITPDDITNPLTLRKFDDVVKDVHAKLKKADVSVPGPYFNGWEVLVVRDLGSMEGPTVFWLCYERCLIVEVLPKGHPDKDILLEHKTERFWNELEAYPMHIFQLPMNIEVDFLGALSFGSSERISEWNNTPFPFTDFQSQRLVKVYRSLKKELDRGNKAVVPALTWHIARTMSKVESVRQQSNFGTPQHQLYRPVVPRSSSLAVKVAETCLMMVLFGAHRTYRVRLQNARVQGRIYLTDFRQLLGNFLAEWSDSNLLATVFVGANIAFLAVPDITNLQRNASLVSIVCSLVSVLTGVHHVWQHRTKVNANFEEANAYLSHIVPLDDGNDSDLAITAIFLSIPLVSLLYAVLSFSSAIAAFCIQNNDVHGKILLSVVLGILGMAGLITFLFFWHVWRGPREVEISEERVEDVLGYGWKSKFLALEAKMYWRCITT